jgi:hypothetical protein
MSSIFISHAVADKALAETLVSFLKEAIGVPAKEIFCSSIDGHDIPFGNDFNQYMKDKIQQPQLVVLLMTPRYMESWFCLMELGATWAKSLKALPIVVPPIKFNVISSTLGLKQGWSIDNAVKIVDLRQIIRDLKISLEPRTEHDWEKKRAIFNASVKRHLKNISPPTSVSAKDFDALKSEIELVRKEKDALEEAYAEAEELIEELKAAKSAEDVKIITAKHAKFDASDRFSELLSNVLDAKPPKISLPFYRNIIMDYYVKSVPINWWDEDQKTDAEFAVQYKVMDSDHPYTFLWAGQKLKVVAAALKELDEFLASEEAEDFVKDRHREGDAMDLDDMSFWEDNLR